MAIDLTQIDAGRLKEIERAQHEEKRIVVVWLPKDERKVLARHYRKNPTGIGWYLGDDLLMRPRDRNVEQIIIALRSRGLTEFDSPGTGGLSVRLTPEGMRLGSKYNSWFSSSGLWFAEHKDHWLWYVLSFLGGIMGALLVSWLSRSPTN